jgi:hypothetical protein
MKVKIRPSRMDAVTKSDGEGNIWIIGYRRKASSRKSGEIMLKTPRLILAARPTAGATETDKTAKEVI